MKKKVMFPHPLRPETFLSDMVKDTEKSYECANLPWFLSLEDVKEVMGFYDLVFEDEYGTVIYRTDGTLEDGTRIVEEVYLGITTNPDSKLVEKGKLAAINISFYMEEEEKAKQLLERFYDQSQIFEDPEKGILPGKIGTGLIYKKESGSYVMVRDIGYMEKEGGLGAQEMPWDSFYGVQIQLWFPIEKRDLMYESVETERDI